MCCRYYYDQKKVNRILEELRIPFRGTLTGGTINPGTASLMITESEASVATWGFPGKEGQLVINARSETAPRKAMFRNALEARRCLLPAECFYEWDSEKNIVTFSEENVPFLLLGGLWTPYGDGNRFVVLTTEANESMEPVHDRMPLIVQKEDAKSWLSDPSFALNYLKREMPLLKAVREYEQLRFM